MNRPGTIAVILIYSEANWLWVACKRAGVDTRELEMKLAWWESEADLYDQEQTWYLSVKQLAALRLFLARTPRQPPLPGLEGMRTRAEGWARRLNAAV